MKICRLEKGRSFGFWVLFGFYNCFWISLGGSRSAKMANSGENNDDFYAVLGLNKECTPTELKNAYKKLAMVRVFNNPFFYSPCFANQN